MNKKTTIFFLVIIFIIGIFFRTYHLASVPPGLYHDEAMNGNDAIAAAESGNYKWFYPENNGREGLYINFAAIPLSIFGNESWALRLTSSIFGILTILGFFLLVKNLFNNNRIALFSSFFMAASFWHILFSRIGFRAIMAVFFLVWAMALLLEARKSKPILWAAIGGLSFGLGFHSYIAYRIAPLLLIIPFVRLWKAGRKKAIAVFLLFAFIGGIPIGLYFLQNPQDFMGRASQVSIFSSESTLQALAVNCVKTVGMLFVVGDFNWRHNLSGSPELWWPVAILTLFGIIISFKQSFCRDKKKWAYRFIISWTIIMCIPVVISSEGLPHALRAIIIIPPIMIFAALGMDAVIEKINKCIKVKQKQYPQYKKQLSRIRKEMVVLLFVFLAAITVHTYFKYFISWGQDNNTYHAFNGKFWDLGKYMDSLETDIQKYVVVNAGGVLADGIPMPAQTVMFAANAPITYLTPENINSIECPDRCAIAIMERDHSLQEKIKNKIPGLKLEIKSEVDILIK